MDAHRRNELLRVAAPIAFLLVVTVAVLLVRGSLRHDDAALVKPRKVHRHAPAPRAVVPVAGSTGATTTTALPATTVVSGRSYTIVAGDTLATIAAKEHTTVDDLLRANPGVTPTNLQIGQMLVVPQ